MLTVLAAAAAIQLAYDFPVAVKRNYDVKVVFEGFIPLLGGQEDAKVEVNLAVEAQGVKPTDKGEAQVLSELQDIKVMYNGATLTIVTVAMARDYFPPTTIAMTSLGATLKTDAPNIQLPVKLPGLDIKRFPDITYLPLQLPEGGAEVGKAYSFKKNFGESDVVYTVSPTAITEETVTMDVALDQKYEVLENETIEVVKDEKEAVSRVTTELKGKGTAIFDRKLGLFRSLDVSADANSVVTDIKSKKTSERKLKTLLVIKYRQPKA